ncbi:MAG TPA: 3-hydroxyacyl-CoA dehydrogenase family protein [Syntrophales bacterium]|nr:3-hydroxyacyl-CoA dehydrogenase family protein [Syntrophales bacterium]
MMKAEDVKSVAVIGAGTMGHAIAQVFARAGIETCLVDLNNDLLKKAVRMISADMKTLVEHGLIDEGRIDAILKNIHPTTDLSEACRNADFILEAVVEVADIKKDVFTKIEAHVSDNAILASNTSSLDIFNIVDLKHPERMVVTHWFAPPHIIPLVEVVPGPATSPDILDLSARLMERVGKKPVVMKKFAPSYIVNRLQQIIGFTVMDMINNDLAAPEDIDLAVKASLGIRLPIVGVVQTFDFTGLDLVQNILTGLLGQAPPFIAERVERGDLGAKSGRGIYDYGKRSEEEILHARDEKYLSMLNQLEEMDAFKPI